ncbi:MAG: restriction endonuclease subunit S [bacterium]
MKPYPAYKDSKLDWLGIVPSHWNIIKLKFNASAQFSNVDKKTEEDERAVRLCNYVDVYYNDFITEKINFMEASASSKEILKFQLKENDVILTKDSEEWDDIAVPAFVPSQIQNVICGYHLAQIRPNNKIITGKYLYYLLSAYRTNHQFKVEATGITRFSLSNYALNNSIILIPERDEQEKIASYLDRKTAQVDDLIDKKERMIELLKEERTAVINQAVTKGLDPNIELKDSGIDWLGNITKNWEVKKLKYLICGKLEYGANEAAELDEGDMPRYIRITDFDDDGKLRNDTFKSLPEDKAKDYLLKSGDILFARSGATVGKTFQFKDYKGKACFAGYLIKATPDTSKILSDFLCYFTRSSVYEDWKNLIFNQATIQNIGADKYSVLSLPLTSVEEQQAIITYLDQKTEHIDKQVEIEKKLIEYLNEYRTALISEVVTGKIDVRN